VLTSPSIRDRSGLERAVQSLRPALSMVLKDEARLARAPGCLTRMSVAVAEASPISKVSFYLFSTITLPRGGSSSAPGRTSSGTWKLPWIRASGRHAAPPREPSPFPNIRLSSQRTILAPRISAFGTSQGKEPKSTSVTIPGEDLDL
jgi:hypothetical protein